MLGESFEHSYHRLQQHKPTSEHETKWQPVPREPKSPLSITITRICIAILVVYSSAITIAYNARVWQPNYSNGFSTEFAPARSSIHLHERRFSGNLHFHANGSSFLHELDYSGPPRPEIDENWKKLVGKRYFYMSAQEAKASWGDAYDGYYDIVDGEKAYVGGLDILHTLHCVVGEFTRAFSRGINADLQNQLRKLLDPEYYRASVHMSQNHNYHCIDQIRQYLICYGDLTPVQTQWNAGKGRMYVESDMLHTCRDFSMVQAFVAGRNVVYG